MPTYSNGWFQYDTEDLAEQYKGEGSGITFRQCLDAKVESGDLTKNTVEWVITEDHLDLTDILGPEADQVGRHKSGIELHIYNKMMAGKLGYVFRLYDDDDEHYFSGRVYDPTGEYDSEFVYEILEWGMRDSGCTSLRFPGRPEWNMS